MDPARAGGKAAGLALLARAGLPIPGGFVVLSDTPDDVVRSELDRRLPALGQGPFAVRSSGVREDRTRRSGAGVFASVVGVAATGVADAVRYCRDSAHGPRARAYFGGAGPGGVAVIVQPMIEGSPGGVAFTVDPRGGGDQIVIESADSADRAVSGRGANRTYVGRDDLRVLRREGARDLSDEQVMVLSRMVLAAERVLGRPADVEWVLSRSGFVLLQIRPITRLSRPKPIWTQRFSGERWTEPATTLGWSIIAPVLAGYTDWRWASRGYLEGSHMVRLVQGVPFFNVTIFRYLLLKLPGIPAPAFVLELFPAAEQAAIRARRWMLPRVGLMLLILGEALFKGRWHGHRWFWPLNPRDWERLAPRIESAAAATLSSPAVDTEGSLDHARELAGWVGRYVGVHLWSLLYANLFYQLLHSLLGDLAHLEPALVSGSGWENLTLRANEAVAALARTLATDPGVAGRVRSAKDGPGALAAVRGTPVERALTELLDRYGHRSRATWEVFAPRWRDEPQRILQMASSQAPVQSASIARGLAARAGAERELLARPMGRLRRWLVGWALGRARVFSLLRENQRFVFDRLMLALRESLLALAHHLEHEGLLLAAGDVVHLTMEEVKELVSGRLASVEAARRIVERRQEASRNTRLRPPTFLGEEPAAPPGPELTGLGVSPGRGRGPARVARIFSELVGVKPGSILVVKAADPGWTPYFPAAAGLVSECGGLLSHAAVVAREYGLPAVANVPEATSRICDGEWLEVDGDTGWIRILPSGGGPSG